MIDLVRRRFCKIIGSNKTAADIGLYANMEKQLENAKTIADCALDNDQIVAFVFRIGMILSLNFAHLTFHSLLQSCSYYYLN